jgi:replicative DNA helicase
LNSDVEKRSASARGKPAEGVVWWEGVSLPQPSDLRESGQIEQDADVILFPCRAETYGIVDGHGEPDRNSACVSVAKNRNGRTGVVGAEWIGHTASYAAGPARSDLL